MAKGSRSQYKAERNKENREKRPHAHHMFARISDTKARIVLEQIKGKPVGVAEAILKYNPRYGAYLAGKVLKSAVANAQENHSLDPDELFVEEVIANQGPTMKRIQPRAKGRAYRINKKTSHITIILNEKKES
ncbi:MAG: 50S ribosomal protein L22 [Defluviitaleaceae bacterium]|nr:50S ribosomal protein L22 [Defluviitaleaceae bacterium]MCL2238800.1 50S ribosomal protein L22 [Defluviitaleaceae bacterium]